MEEIKEIDFEKDYKIVGSIFKIISCEEQKTPRDHKIILTFYRVKDK